MHPWTLAQLEALDRKTKDEFTGWVRNVMTAMICNADLIVIGCAKSPIESAEIVTHVGRQFICDLNELLKIDPAPGVDCKNAHLGTTKE